MTAKQGRWLPESAQLPRHEGAQVEVPASLCQAGQVQEESQMGV